MPTLTILKGPQKGRTFRFERSPVAVGRASDVVPLTDSTISRRHAELRTGNGAWVIVDLKSANGTYLNGKRVERPMPLKHGDTIRLGGTLLSWADERAAPPVPAPDLIDLDVGSREIDSSVISSIPGSDDSVILATPAAADAVRAWRVMAQLVDCISAAPTTDQLLERVMDILFEEVPVQRGFILMKPADGGDFVPKVVRFRNPADAGSRIAASRTLIEHVVSKREAVLCTNAMTDERFSGRRRSGSMQAIGLRSVICAPIMVRSDVLGLIQVDNAMASHIYTEEQLRLVTAIGRMSGIAIEDAQLVHERVELSRLAATGEAVAALSHYIKNILQGVQSGADVVEMGLSRQQLGTVDQGWQIVQRNLERILNLSMNMLAYAKDREPRLEMVLLNRAVRDVVELIQRRADDKGATIRLDLEEPLPPIPLDADGIHQVILNLLTNAVDAVAKSAGAVTVRTHFDAAKSEAILSVGDNGPGIAAEQMPHLFVPFHSTKGQGGTGLGLAVMKKIVEEHRGRIEVKSEADHGTLFTVFLPATAPPALDSGATLAAGDRRE